MGFRIAPDHRALNGHTIKVNDHAGNPVEIAAVVVWKVQDTAQAAFDVENFEDFVSVQSETAVRHLASIYPYDESGRVELAADCHVPNPLDLLAFLAGQTERLGLATGVLVLPNHHPVVLAKRAATVDALSGGIVTSTRAAKLPTSKRRGLAVRATSTAVITR